MLWSPHNLSHYHKHTKYTTHNQTTTMSSFNGAYANKLNERVKQCVIDLVVADLVIQKNKHSNGILCRHAVNKAIAALAGQKVKMNKNTLCKKVARASKSEPTEDGPPSNKKTKPSPENEVPEASPTPNDKSTPSPVRDIPCSCFGIE